MREREIQALWTAMEELDSRTGHIVTLDDKPEELKKDSRKIQIIPGWQYFLAENL